MATFKKILLALLIVIAAIFLSYANYARASNDQQYSFLCKFNHGTSKKIDEKSTFLISNLNIEDILFKNVDFSLRTGKVVFNGYEGDISLIAWEDENSFVKVHLLEKSDDFNIIFTSIYVDKKSSAQKFPATHSRHVKVNAGNPTLENYVGFCQLI